MYLQLPEAPWHLFTLSSCVLAPDILLAGRSQDHCYSMREETEAPHPEVRLQGIYARGLDIMGPLLHVIL